MGKQHLNSLAVTAGLIECGRAIHGPGHITGILIDIARDLA